MRAAVICRALPVVPYRLTQAESAEVPVPGLWLAGDELTLATVILVAC